MQRCQTLAHGVFLAVVRLLKRLLPGDDAMVVSANVKVIAAGYEYEPHKGDPHPAKLPTIPCPGFVWHAGLQDALEITWQIR